VQFNEIHSSMLTIKCGVPQGSILGPLFFIVYINDLANISKVTESLLFADDTSIFYPHADTDQRRGGGCSGAECRVVSVMCAACPSTTVFEL
jgi:hypothetical protein